MNINLHIYKTKILDVFLNVGINVGVNVGVNLNAMEREIKKMRYKTRK